MMKMTTLSLSLDEVVTYRENAPNGSLCSQLVFMRGGDVDEEGNVFPSQTFRLYGSHIAQLRDFLNSVLEEGK